MLSLQNYTVTQRVSTGTKNVVYRGYRNADRTPVIIKTPQAPYPTLKEIAKLKHEYELVRSLPPELGIVHPLALETYQKSIALILEDFGGIALSEKIDARPLSMAQFLPMAIALAEGLGQIHAQQIIHKDIKPSNIIVDSEGAIVKITDFGISSQLSSEDNAQSYHNALEGTLIYISPEQTGRMNRTIDYRTDLYSLGITYYEMLTGQPPFTATEPLELIHAHLAKQPPNLLDLNPKLPSILAKIILKLLEKNAEHRYQTAFILKQDLDRCWQDWQAQGQISEFAIAQDNISEQFQIPQKLYGRDAEVRELLSAFEFASTGHAELILISGYSGIGKSSLVYEVHKPIVRQKGFFVSGKFDQFQRDVPYASLIQALQELIRKLLTETAAVIQQWREKLQVALRQNGQVIVDVIPELELIVGSQSAVPDLGPTEAQNRFNLVFQDFIGVFTQAEHPLVIFLDDLQWADSASLKFIELLMTNLDSHHLLLIGAYRDNEVSPSHPLMLTLGRIQAVGAVLKDITIQPLSLAIAQQLIAETLHTSLEATQTLAELCQQKTAGNPFFLTQLLKSLHSDRFISFNLAQGCWQWDLTQIEAAAITENVVELMVAKLEKLAPRTQEMLRLAACIGNRFDLNVLATVQAQSWGTTAKDLWPSLQAGFVLPLSDTYKIPLLWQPEETIQAEQPDAMAVSYRFLHDRVQQAAYALIPDSDKQQTHLKIGQLLLQNIPEDELDEQIFDIVNHLNVGVGLITAEHEREQLAQLNLQAGKKAKSSTAYEPACKHFSQGIDCLSETAWQTQYNLMFELSRERSECEYLCGHLTVAEDLFKATLAQARSAIDRAELQNIRILLYENTGKYPESLETGAAILQEFGITIPVTDTNEIATALDTELDVYYQHLETIEIAELINAPLMDSPADLTCLNVLMHMSGPAYFTNQDLLALIVLKMTNLSMERGISELAPHGFAFWGVVAGARLTDYERSYAFGSLAMQVNQKYPNANITCKICNLFGAHISHWRSHLRESIPILRQGCQVGIETGDIYAGYNSYNLIMQRMMAGEHPDDIIAESNKLMDFSSKMKNHVFVGVQAMDQHFLLNFRGETLDCFSLSDADFKEEDCVQLWQDNLFLPGVATYNIFKTQIYYLYGDYERALAMARKSESETLIFVSGITNQAEHNFYYSLTLIALYPDATLEQQQAYQQQLEKNQKTLQFWAENCPNNYAHKYRLVQAEWARVQGQVQAAMDFYDVAIASAQTHGFIHCEALANEQAAKFWLAQGREPFARLYLTEAYHCYLRWQATRKAQYLQAQYPQLIQQQPTPTRSRRTISSSHDSTEMRTAAALDLATIMRASQTLSGEIKLEKILRKLMQLLLENAGATQGYLLLPQQQSTTQELTLMIEAEGIIEQAKTTADIKVLQNQSVGDRLPHSLLNYVMRTQDNIVLADAIAHDTFGSDPYIQTHEPKAILCAPLLHQGQLGGVIYLENNLTAAAFSHERLEVVKLLSSQAAISLENARFYQTLEDKVTQRTAQLAQRTRQLAAANTEITQLNDRLKAENLRMGAELDVAQRVQEMILPRTHELAAIPALDIAGSMTPAEEVGGDYYDVLVEDDLVTIAIGDVTGHGLESGLVMMMTQTTVRTLTKLRETDPVRFLNTVNATLYDNVQRMGVDRNLTLALLNYAEGQLSISGQHEEVLLVRADGSLHCLDTLELGMTIGLVDDIQDFITQTTVELQPGDGVVLYTDGIPEAKNVAGDYYGLERLCGAVQTHWQRSARGVLDAVLADLQGFIGAGKVMDDITLLVLKQR
ncbi:MAG: AAA family ATPase [Cyanobacteria bacterium P01_G01_bin.54]